MASAIINIDVESEAKAEKISSALILESKTTARFRSNVTIKKAGKTVKLYFEAPDITSLRASINSFCRWVWMLNKTLEVIKILESRESNNYQTTK